MAANFIPANFNSMKNTGRTFTLGFNIGIKQVKINTTK